jgi:hypothetical protein
VKRDEGVLKRGDETSERTGKGVMCFEVKGREVKGSEVK